MAAFSGRVLCVCASCCTSSEKPLQTTLSARTAPALQELCSWTRLIQCAYDTFIYPWINLSNMCQSLSKFKCSLLECLEHFILLRFECTELCWVPRNSITNKNIRLYLWNNLLSITVLLPRQQVRKHPPCLTGSCGIKYSDKQPFCCLC